MIPALGRRASRHDARTLSFRRYMAAGLPPAPPLVDWADAVTTIDEYRNNEIGDCALASTAHMIATWEANNGRQIAPSLADVERAYGDVGGYVEGDPSTWDNGADMLSVANYWRRTGIGGHRIRAFLRLDSRDVEQVKLASWLFGPLYVGASLPLRAQEQRSVWILPSARNASDRVGSWGGHAMACPRFDRSGGTFFTWGGRQNFDWAWWTEYVDEAYCALSDDWIGNAGDAPNGFDFDALEHDLAAIGARA